MTHSHSNLAFIFCWSTSGSVHLFCDKYLLQIVCLSLTVSEISLNYTLDTKVYSIADFQQLPFFPNCYFCWFYMSEIILIWFRTTLSDIWVAELNGMVLGVHVWTVMVLLSVYIYISISSVYMKHLLYKKWNKMENSNIKDHFITTIVYFNNNSGWSC